MAPSRALLSSLPSPCAASLPFPFPLSPLAPAEPPLACGGSREQRAPSGTRRMGRGVGADQLSLHEHRGEHATSIMSFPRIRCALVPRVSSQAAKHTRAPFGVAGLTGAPLSSLSPVSSELSVRHLSPPALPSRSSQSNQRDERKAHTLGEGVFQELLSSTSPSREKILENSGLPAWSPQTLSRAPAL